jgi:hypothetical protein
MKTKTIYDNSKSNKVINEYTPSFRKIFPKDMNPVMLNYYTEAMKDMVEENKLRRKREVREMKKQKDKEKQMKMVKKSEEEKSVEKIEIKKPTQSIVKSEVKPIRVGNNGQTNRHIQT